MESAKRTARIRVEPIPDDLHHRLICYSQLHRYSRLMDALYYAAAIGLSVLEIADAATITKFNGQLQPVTMELRK